MHTEDTYKDQLQLALCMQTPRSCFKAVTLAASSSISSISTDYRESLTINMSLKGLKELIVWPEGAKFPLMFEFTIAQEYMSR